MNQAKRELQKFCSFPNDNSKIIDYIIVYEDFDGDTTDPAKIKILKKRKEFFKQLKVESFELYDLQNEHDGKKTTFTLLHCPVERLLQEAENFRLEMRLKNCNMVELEKAEDNELKNFINKFRRPIKNDKGNIISSMYDPSIRFMFEGIDDPDKYPNGPFSNTIRSLLVDNILKNISYLSENEKMKLKLGNTIKNIIENNANTHEIEQENSGKMALAQTIKVFDNINSYKGLPYMLKKKYFEDAFILHDETTHKQHLRQFFNYIDKQNLANEPISAENVYENLISFDNSGTVDIRKDLFMKWASFKNIFKYQPMWDIRNYFGESNAFYFAFVGVFISSLWIPTLIGFIFFIYGLHVAINTNSTISYSNSTLTNVLRYSSFYGNVFTLAFDNELIPYFALIICLWGAFFMEIWKRENSRLAFEWDVENFERFEVDLPEYVRIKKVRAKKESKFWNFIWKYEHFYKKAISVLVLMFMIGIVALDIALVVVFRIYIKTKVFSNNDTLKLILGDLGSIVLNTAFILVFNLVYNWIAVQLTKWENHRTKTDYDDNLIVKLFAFEFVNSYGSLFYLAYFRNVKYTNGLFNLGPEYQDKCDNDNCMALLSTQVLILILVKPVSRFITAVIYPYIYEQYKKKTINHHFTSIKRKVINENNYEYKSIDRIFNEKLVFYYANVEKNKEPFADTIADEYNEKAILYGYAILFGASFSLAPLIVLIVNLFDLRIDAKRLLWLYRRPVGYKAQDIGSWFTLCRFLNVMGIINNAFLVAYTSNWSTTYLRSTNEYKLLFIVCFEHVVFLIWFLIIFALPDVPADIQKKMRQESQYLKEIISIAKNGKKNNVSSDSPNLIEKIDEKISNDKKRSDFKNDGLNISLPGSFDVNELPDDYVYDKRIKSSSIKNIKIDTGYSNNKVHPE